MNFKEVINDKARWTVAIGNSLDIIKKISEAIGYGTNKIQSSYK